jgi:hypothetical protein
MAASRNQIVVEQKLKIFILVEQASACNLGFSPGHHLAQPNCVCF